MYAIMAFLAAMVMILSYMAANKEPVVQNETPAEEARAPQREIMFNLTPPPDEDDDSYVPNIDIEEDDIPDDDDDPDIERLNQKMYAVSAVNIRSGPGTDFDRVGSLSANQEVRAVGRSSSTGWFKIEHRDGYAFVSGSFLELAEEED